MDYKSESTIFKLKKVARYVKIYGFNRTLKKVESQLHMGKEISFDGAFWNNEKTTATANLAIVGCGNFSFSTIAHYVSESANGEFKYALDIDKSRALSLAMKYKCHATTDFDRILSDDAVKLIYIASNHASHAEYAIQALEKGKCVHIEKPHAVTLDQLNRLDSAMQSNSHSRVFLGFNRPQSYLFESLLREMGKQQGSSMLNWFIAGHEIEDDHWYFAEEEGGRILGNLCHWSDLCIHLIGKDKAFPCTISPCTHDRLDNSNFAVSISFADGSQAAITFSAKGHTFEGVREFLNVHKGNILASLSDFHKLIIDDGDKRRTYRKKHRDHGHKSNIVNSYTQTFSANGEGESRDYIYATGLFVLKIKEAVDTGQTIKCDPITSIRDA